MGFRNYARHLLARCPELSAVATDGGVLPVSVEAGPSRGGTASRVSSGVTLHVADCRDYAAGPPGHSVTVTISHDRGVFDRAFSGRTAAHLQVLLAAALTGSTCPIWKPPVVADAERHRPLVDWSGGALDIVSDRCLHQPLEARAAQTPDAIEEIATCPSSGATVVIRGATMLNMVAQFPDECTRHQTTVLDLPTAYWHELTDALSSDALRLPPRLRLAIIGGEQALADRVVR